MASPAQSGSRRTGALTAGMVSYRSYSAIRACASLGFVAHRDKRWRCFAGLARSWGFRRSRSAWLVVVAGLTSGGRPDCLVAGLTGEGGSGAGRTGKRRRWPEPADGGPRCGAD
jgi:hypothetical protein